MATKTITIKESAYNALRKEKAKEESFSEVILRLTKARGSLSECFGSWSVGNEEWGKIEKLVSRKWKGFHRNY